MSAEVFISLQLSYLFMVSSAIDLWVGDAEWLAVRVDRSRILRGCGDRPTPPDGHPSEEGIFPPDLLGIIKCSLPIEF
jgi:hypothetical protein